MDVGNQKLLIAIKLAEYYLLFLVTSEQRFFREFFKD